MSFVVKRSPNARSQLALDKTTTSAGAPREGAATERTSPHLAALVDDAVARQQLGDSVTRSHQIAAAVCHASSGSTATTASTVGR